MIVQAEAVADYLRETREHQGRRGQYDHVPALPRRPARAHAEGPQGRGGAGTHRPAAGRRPAADPRSARHHDQVHGKRQHGRARRRALPGLRQLIRPGDMPRCTRAAYGLGSRDLQPEGLVAAVENMLADGGHRKVLLPVRRFRPRAGTARPSRKSTSRSCMDAYPDRSRTWRIKGSENPNLLPEGAITVRMHSVGGWGAITTGKNLAMTLYRPAGLRHQGQSQVRLGKEGPADHLLTCPPRRNRSGSTASTILSTWCCRRTPMYSATPIPFSA